MADAFNLVGFLEPRKHAVGKVRIQHLVQFNEDMAFLQGRGAFRVQQGLFAAFNVTDNQRFLVFECRKVVDCKLATDCDPIGDTILPGQFLAQVHRILVNVMGVDFRIRQHPRQANGVIAFGATDIDDRIQAHIRQSVQDRVQFLFIAAQQLGHVTAFRHLTHIGHALERPGLHFKTMRFDQGVGQQL